MESLLLSEQTRDVALGPLADLVRRGRERARALQQPVLVSYAFALPDADPLALAAALVDYREPGVAPFRFHWEQPDRHFALAGGGVAAQVTAEGEGRFGAAAGDAQRLQAAAVSTAGPGVSAGALLHGPHLVGGFSFFAGLAPEQWQGFGPAQLVAPAWLLRRHKGALAGQVSQSVDEQADVEAVAAKLAARMEAVSKAAAVRPAEPPGRAPMPGYSRLERSDGRDVWLDVVGRAREVIRQGRLAKVVLARALDLACEAEPSPYGLLGRLRAAYPHCYCFMVDAGAGQTFVGATPERLVRFDAHAVHMAAVAGTVPRGATAKEEAAHARHLLDSHKERQEHAIVVDGIVSAVEPFGQVERPEAPQLLKLKHVQHLHTPITLRLKARMPVLELLAHLHPTPAVGGHPRPEAFALIRELEHFDRGWYASPVGWMDARGEGEFAVALRSGTITGQRMRLFAGGGIVADSDPEREYEETQIKFQPLLTALAND